MFNNPFNSFHETVAEAKEEREQLDRLLTISTPRERLLVVGIALLLLVLAAWLFFGRMALSVAVNGVLVEPAGNQPVEALVWVEGDIAPRIATGMPAVIELTTADGEAETLRGEVASVAGVPLSEALGELESAAPLSLYRLGIVLDATVDPASLAGSETTIVIELGREPLAALFGMRRP